MAKIVELEKQLMQRNKELDVIRVSATGELGLGAAPQGSRLLPLGAREVPTPGRVTSVGVPVLSLGHISSRMTCVRSTAPTPWGWVSVV